MSTTITSGPARSAHQKTRKTWVARHAYYVPWDNGGAGGWRYLPVDTVHGQTIEGTDGFGNPTRAVDSYIHKGFVPVEMIPEGDPRLDALPLNWREHAMKGATPEWRVDPVVQEPPVDATASAREFWVERAASEDPSED